MFVRFPACAGQCVRKFKLGHRNLHQGLQLSVGQFKEIEMKKALAIAAAILLTGSIASAKEVHKKTSTHTTGTATNANKAAKNTNSETTPSGDLNSTKNNPTLQSLQSK